MAQNNNNNEVRITFKAFNEEYNKAMKEMDKETNELKQQLKLQAEQMKHSATATEKLEAKLNGLHQTQELARRKTQETQEALQRAKEIWGENSEEVRKFEAQLRRHQIAEQQTANAIIETEQALERARNAYADQTRSMQQLQRLFDATGSSLEDFTNVLGADLTRAIQDGTASARQLDRAFDLISRSALGAETDINEIRQALNRLDDGGSVDDVRRDLRRLSSDARDAREEVKRLGSELGRTATAAGAIGTASLGGLVVGTEDVATDLAMLNTQISKMTVNVGSMTRTTKQQLEVMADGFSKQESALSDSLASREKAMQKSHDNQQRALEKQMDKQFQTVESGYEKQEEALESKLSKEYDAVVKNYDKQQEALEKSLEKEVEEFQKASDEKIAIIDKEYMEKMKLIDEEKYNQLKAIDDQINSLNARTEAEDKAIKQRENAEKRADLKRKISEAKTLQDRADAQKELSKFEEKLKLDAIREQRREQIESLRNEKEVIKESADARKDALKEETDVKKDQAKTQIEIEKKAMQDRHNEAKKAFKEMRDIELSELQASHKAQIKSLQDMNKARLDALREEQNARKEALSERLANEAEAVRQSHADELESFKAMTAAKMKEAEKPIQSRNNATVAVDFEIEDIRDVQTNFLSVRQDVDQITEAMGNLIRAGYTSEEQLRKVSEVIAGSIISGGDTFNAEGLAESIATTTQLGEATGQFMDLLEKNTDKTGMTIEDFNEKIATMGTVTERANYITGLLTNAGMKELFDAYKSGNPEIIEAAEAQLNLTQASTDLANVLRPLVTDVKNILASIMAWAAENPVVAKSALVISAALTALGVAFGVISGIVVNVVSAFKLLGGGTGGSGILAKLSTLFVNIGSKILPALRIAFGALTGPIGIVIAVLTTAVPLIIKHWDVIAEFFGDIASAIWKAISGVFNKVLDFIKTILTKVWNFIKDILSKISKMFSFSDLLTNVKKAFDKVYGFITSPVEKARDAIRKIIDTIKGFFKFKFEWPEMKIPRLKIKKGSLNPVKWFTEGFPEIDIEWFANGGIMTRPTIFGGNGGTLYAGGEAGKEAILPLNERVLGMLGNAIFRASNGSNNGGQTIIHNYEKLLDGAIFQGREETDIKKVSRAVADQITKNRRGRLV